MNPLFNLPSRFLTQKTQGNGAFPRYLPISGHFISLASDIGDLEECLALERASEGHLPVNKSTRIRSPQAVPYCEFLMVRDSFGRLLAVTRVFCAEAGSSIRRPGNSSSTRPCAFLTALRYSRLGILELGAPAFLPNDDAVFIADLIGQGLIVYLDRKGLALVAGWDALMDSELEAELLPHFMDAYGLPTDLKTESHLVPFPEGTHATISGTNPPSSRER